MAVYVEGAGQPTARLARQLAVDTELVEDPDHDAADVVLGAVGAGQGPDEEVKRLGLISLVERRERVAEVEGRLAPLELDPGREPVGGKAAGHVLEDRERTVGVIATEQDAGQRHGGIGPGGLELHRAAQRVLVALGDEAVGLGGEQRVQEAVDRRGGLGPDELGHHAAVAEGLDRRDALDPEGAGHARVRVDVELGQLDLALTGGHGLLDHRPELAARAAPLGPEVDDDGDRARALENR